MFKIFEKKRNKMKAVAMIIILINAISYKIINIDKEYATEFDLYYLIGSTCLIVFLTTLYQLFVIKKDE